MASNKKFYQILLVTAVVVTAAIFIYNKNRSQQSKPKTREELIAAGVISPAPVIELGIRIKQAIDKLKKESVYCDYTTMRNDEQGWIYEYRELIKACDTSVVYKEQIPVLKKAIADAQLKLYPCVRKKYAEDLKQKAWIEDVEVAVSGKGNTTLILTGYIFAANRSKQEIAETISPTAKLLRFKRLEFYMYKGSEYTSYDLKTDDDGDISYIETPSK